MHFLEFIQPHLTLNSLSRTGCLYFSFELNSCDKTDIENNRNCVSWFNERKHIELGCFYSGEAYEYIHIIARFIIILKHLK